MEDNSVNSSFTFSLLLFVKWCKDDHLLHHFNIHVQFKSGLNILSIHTICFTCANRSMMNLP